MSNFDEGFFKDLLREEREECLKGPGIDLDLHEAFVEACQSFQDAKEAKETAEEDLENCKKSGDKAGKAEAEEMFTLWTQSMEDAIKKCVETAKPILETIDLMEYDLEMSLLRTAILTRATPKGFSKFANLSDLNGQLIETLLNNKKIMKEMLLAGGARDNEFGNAMKLYTLIMAGCEKDRFHKVNKRIAMAAALEFCTTQTEFDTSVEIDAQERFNHYEKAHRKGELDPAFTHFRTWEYRMAINSDAPHEQLQWGRDMLMNYAPHIATIYNETWRYSYQVKTDVGYRPPKWTASPRTYQQVLSGGGREGPRAWYGRFICQAFGIPVWGVKQPGNMAVGRWTPKGWVINFSLPGDWGISSWENRPGLDFIEDAKARSGASEQEYYERVILLGCLADACKEKNKKIEEAGFVNPNKVWRSLSLMQRKIYADMATEESHQRTGPGVVVSKIEKYIQEIDQNAPPLPFEVEKRGGLIIPAASFTESNGKKKAMPNPAFGGGTQLHLVDGDSWVTYDIPANVTFQEDKDYLLSALVCTVHLEQQPLLLDVDGGAKYEIEIPFTEGQWQETTPVKIEVGGLSSLKFYRKKSDTCFGIAIKNFTLAPC
mmetsp:Transcript_25942/g.39852  ORF Transcript_25942/g.39852 Transcript_25942/m.39852 type:complete len:602 (+) Transcript_25942:253-2058(+)|eukprot:CAMPEP_0117004354 /NCGR_PEP_ID=MMETSP0472-20121206/5356_1 /TAXON_ID=693140 ORGANISM="Tiarina fusus, Strain LIS" /NCGR_SAMPLE_ID=MMETSP0472 /ASSEMBLY_ACC=CAM_ASM_000603 /LENGTH=601 /DNA_ID=CAMNT_0004705283 /DNA_START=252 /DNA_END=2057 /DNA_ORIENTATION=-